VLPPRKPHVGLPGKDHRLILNGILQMRSPGTRGTASLPVRQYLKERRIGAVIPTKIGHAPDPAFDRVASRERNVVERLINRLTRWRRVATRDEKRAATYRTMVTIAAILLWL
jgi:transposase